jgi:radical SAM protein with 4Fe4S-binding SPASM domain
MKKVLSQIFYKLNIKVRSLGLKICYLFKLNRIPILPIELDIEPNNTCNFSCSHCQVTHWQKDHFYLNQNTFKNIINCFPILKSIKLQGMGEPLLNKDLFNMLKIGSDLGIKMEIFTNGSVYNEEIWDKLMDLKNLNIQFSIDGATSTLFEKIRVNGNFEKVINNAKSIISKRKSRKQLLTFWTVVTKENLDELPLIIQLAKDTNVDEITFQTFLNNWAQDNIKSITKDLEVDTSSQKYFTMIDEAQQRAKELNVKLNIYKDNYLSKKNKCRWPFRSAFISANGDVVPCCVLSNSDIIKMGNIFEEPFKDIWNSKAYIEFRERIKKHDLYDFCKNCYNED